MASAAFLKSLRRKFGLGEFKTKGKSRTIDQIKTDLKNNPGTSDSQVLRYQADLKALAAAQARARARKRAPARKSTKKFFSFGSSSEKIGFPMMGK